MKLDKDRVLEPMAKADTKWFNSHSSKYDYREHLEFTADYIARNYDKKSKQVKVRSRDGSDKVHRLL